LNIPGWLNRLMPSPVEDAPGDGAPTEPEPVPGDDLLAARLRGMARPVPITRGEVIDLPRKAVQQDFPFHQGGALPVRAARGARQEAAPEPAGTIAATRTEPDDDPFPAWLRSQPEAPPPGSPPEPPPEPLPEPPLDTEDPSTQATATRKDHTMGNVDVILKDAMQIDGAIGAALVDYESGMTLGQSGGAMFNLEVAAAGNTDVVRSKLRTMEALGIHETIQDILITLDSQYHLIRLLSSSTGSGLFLYLALHKNQSNLAMARHQLATLERRLEI
jgi:hypothetical protein